MCARRAQVFGSLFAAYATGKFLRQKLCPPVRAVDPDELQSEADQVSACAVARCDHCCV